MFKDIFIFAAKFPNFVRVGNVCQASFVYVIVTNHVNWHRENLRSNRENAGNLKMQFGWVPPNVNTSVNCYLVT